MPENDRGNLGRGLAKQQNGSRDQIGYDAFIPSYISQDIAVPGAMATTLAPIPCRHRHVDNVLDQMHGAAGHNDSIIRLI